MRKEIMKMVIHRTHENHKGYNFAFVLVYTLRFGKKMILKPKEDSVRTGSL